MTKISPAEMEHVLATDGMMSKRELEWLAETASRLTSWTEVGVHFGRSALAAGLSLPVDGRLQLVDIHFHPQLFRTLTWFHAQRPQLVIVLCLATSEQAAKILPMTDGAFVDDDHSYKGVCKSIKGWQGCPVFCGHDYSTVAQGHDGVKRAVNEFFPDAIHPVGTIWARRAGL